MRAGSAPDEARDRKNESMKLGTLSGAGAKQSDRNGGSGTAAAGRYGRGPHHGSGRRREERGDGAGREQILAAARELFLEHSFAEVSMQQIADAVGMTKAALYYHFEDKVDLFANVVLAEMRTGIQGIEDAIAAGGSREEILLRVANRLYEFSRPRAIRMMEEFGKIVPESQHEAVHLKFLQMQEMALRCFSAPTADGTEWDIPPDLAAMIFIHLAGSLIPHHPHPYPALPESAETRAKLLVHLFLHGMASPLPAPLAKAVAAASAEDSAETPADL